MENIKGKIVKLINHHMEGEIGKVFRETNAKCLIIKINGGLVLARKKDQIKIL